VDAGRRLLRYAADGLGEPREPALRLLLQGPPEEREEDFLLLRAGRVEKGGVAVLGAQAEMDEHRRVAAVVEDHVGRAAVAPLEQLGGERPIFLEALALVGVDRDAGGRDRRRGMVLGRVDVARHPADVGAERRERLDQDRGLDRHVQRAGDARALERLLFGVLLAHRHEARHLGLGDRDLLAAPLGEADVLDRVIIVRDGLPGGGLRHGVGFLWLGRRLYSSAPDRMQSRYKDVFI
jgi:hypothetical protein